MSRYRKLYPRFWKDERIRSLDPLNKLIASYCLTGQSNRIGLFSFSPGMAAEDTGIPTGTFWKRFRRVCQTLHWTFDETSSALYIPTWWKWNEPEGPNQLIGCLSDVKDLPETPLKSLFYNNTEYFSPTLCQTFTQTLQERYPQPLPILEQEQEQEISLVQKSESFISTEISQNGYEPIRLPETALSLATKLQDSILANYPDARKATESQLITWAVDIDKLNRLDGKTWEQIEWLLAWSQKDPFWSANIQSGAKFRKQWNQLLAKASKEQPKYSAPMSEEELMQESSFARLVRETREKSAKEKEHGH